ncbi:nucleotidase [Mesobacillus campisalis]|uniref:Nucleotidase n=1 Tax=Mesobacillus campisalis TaxID=1408103 RepID=A0A0M2SHS1_9BACI|nr:nucleotidase [Mesobacillus campisalis]KKK33176.1 nucleotidase [Mesobacillus campisalis]
MRKRFGIDIDGTVTCPSSMVPFLNQQFNLNITLDDIVQYDLMPLVSVSEQEFSSWFTSSEPVIYAKSPLAKGARDVLSEWSKEHELFFISARGKHLIDVTTDWFMKHNLEYDHIELIGSHNKIAAARKYEVDIFFEDKHDNAVMIHEDLQIPVLLFNTPYNQDPIPDGVIRVNDWYEARVWVDRWVNQKG